MKKAQISAGFIQIILILVVVALIGGAYYFGTQKNKSEVVSETPTEEPFALETQKPSTPTVKPTSDPTANWRRIVLLNYDFKVPNNWKYLECNKSLVFVGSNIDKDSSEICEFDGYRGLISVSRLTDPQLFKIPINTNPNLDPYVVKKENVTIGGIPAIKQTEKVSSGMGEGQRVYVYIKTQEYMDTIIWQDVAQEKLFDQILSTFKFTK